MIDTNISEIIRKKRHMDGLTVQQLAEKADVSISLVSKLERNVLTTINLDKLSSIAHALNLDLSDLFGVPQVDDFTQSVISHLLALPKDKRMEISEALVKIMNIHKNN
ncbi:helix-turn-helix domain-containing protein [Pediococcus pentosaceus]|uniref:helix-turn-helix domain-containing protein n=1 Tax=Pediococcus pentosaceus TaxID=1255 RepID=UPI00223BDBF8|nr:helix-turn-helix transcriptional regulator [Pediococcus pentosaceus]MCS8569767.1 XRE family transcriptional regulator [Pediococcus pentosaceus]MCT1177732.1 XRE family transcriptional regulator [Pediococcus pentosaceus]MCT3024637.1 XRE family transcriptional regulator [Pediococcus pentosaceus]